MDCPWCTDLNLNYKTILLSGFYVCENDDCGFCESEDYFSSMKIDSPTESYYCEFSEFFESGNNNLNNNNSLDNMLLDNINADIDNVSRIKLSDNNLVVSNNIDKNILENTLKNSLFENLFDFSVNGNITQELTQTETVDNVSEMNDLLEIVDLNSYNNNCEDKSEEIICADKENSIKTTKKKCKNKRDKSKLSVIDQSISEGLDINFYHYKNKLFNWLRMPYSMKTHSKIIRILLLHLDVFKFPDTTSIVDIKREYSVCETIANQFRIDTVRFLCYGFLDKLYNIIEKIPDKNLVNKEIDERVVCLLKNVFNKYDLSSSLKFEYKTDLCCSFCSSKKSIESKDYLLVMERSKSHLKIYENKLVYGINCLKCMKKLTKTVSFTSVPQFVIFHCPKGLKEDISKYDNKIYNNDGRKLSVVAVIEIGSKYPFVEAPENQMSWHSYDIRDTIMDTRCRPSYCVHFRNKFGWFSLNGYKQFLCSPQDTLSIFSLSDVRFVILGEISDPLVYRQQFSIQDLINKSEDCFKKSIEKLIFDSSSNEVSEKPSKKIFKPKSKRKLKLKNCIKTEENVKQFPRILKKINCDFQCDPPNDENKNISVNNGGNSSISNKRNFSSTNNQIPAGNIKVRNDSSRYKSSKESYESSVLENYGFSKRKKLDDDEFLSQSISNKFSRKIINSESNRELFSIDDLITKHSNKISKNF